MKTACTWILVPLLSVASFAQSPAHRRAPGWEGIAIVVDRNNPVSDVSLAQLREMFLGERCWWTHERPITLVAMARRSAERQTVLHGVYQMDEKDVEKHFLLKVFRGELSRGPTEFAKASDMKKFISRTPGSLGYMRAADVDHTVKVLRIDGLSPEDDGYPLRLRVRRAK